MRKVTGKRGRADLPDSRGPGWYLWWLVVCQPWRVLAGAVFGTLWMITLAAMPYILSQAIDQGLRRRDLGALLGWSGALLAAGIASAWLSIMRHRRMSRIRMEGTFQTIAAVTKKATELGAELSRRVSAGEVVTVGVNDVRTIAQALTITGPGVGSVLAYGIIAAVLLNISPLLAAVVLVGVPLLAIVVGPLLGRLQGVETTYRHHQGALTGRLIDIVQGLGVLNGLGGKETFAASYRQHSRDLQTEGYRVAAVSSWIQSLGVSLSALFLAVVTWLAARMAAAGAITVGDLVAVYGYAAVLIIPVSFFIEGGYDLSRALVVARRVVRILALERDHDQLATAIAPTEPATLFDPESGVEIHPGEFTALVSARSQDAATVLERLARFEESEARWGTVPLGDVPLDAVRERILSCRQRIHALLRISARTDFWPGRSR